MIICIALYTYMYKMFSIDIDIFKFFFWTHFPHLFSSKYSQKWNGDGG